MVEIAREVCGSVRVGGKNPKSVWWNDEIKAVVGKGVLTANNEETKERCLEAYREEKRKSNKKVNEQFRRKMSEAVNGNRKLFWNEVSNAEGGKVRVVAE